MVRKIRHFLWLLLVSGASAYATFIVLGAVVDAKVQADVNTVTVRDLISKRTHDLSGIIMLPSDCHELTTRVSEIDLTNYRIDFRTWKDPNRECRKEPVPQHFAVKVFAPSVGVQFQAAFDDAPIPLEVITTTGKR